jgi:hypothetical protein
MTFQSQQPMPAIHEGDRFQTSVEIPVACSYDWRSRSSFVLFATSIPAGEQVICLTGSGPHAASIKCRLIRYRTLLPRFVPLRFRLQFWRFRGYAFWIPVKKLLNECVRLK